MKQYVLIAALLAAIALGATQGLAATPIPDLNATLLYYEPVPAAPGSLLTVFVQVDNEGTTAEQVTVRLIDNGPFTIENEAERVKTTSSIPSQESFLVQYRVRVSKDALPGTNYIKVEYSTGDTANVRTKLLPIEVFSSTVALSIESVTMDPDIFIPGSVGKLTLRLRNDAGLKISSGTVKLDLTEVDLVPMSSSSQQRFTELQAGQVQDIHFDLAPAPSMAPGIYRIPLNLSFNDQQGNSYSLSEFIGIRVGAEPDISVTVEDVQPLEDKSEVFIRVTNKGLGEVKFVTITIGNSEAYTLSGSNERYIGNIDSDDYKTARVQLTADERGVELPVTIEYMDSLNQEYTQQATLTFERPAAEGGSSSGIVIFVIIVLLAIGGYLLLRRRKR